MRTHCINSSLESCIGPLSICTSILDEPTTTVDVISSAGTQPAGMKSSRKNYGRARACGHHLVGCDERAFCWNKNQTSIEKYVCCQLSSVVNSAPIRVLFLDEIIESDLAG